MRIHKAIPVVKTGLHMPLWRTSRMVRLHRIVHVGCSEVPPPMFTQTILFDEASAFGFALIVLKPAYVGNGLKSEVKFPWLKSLTTNLTASPPHSNTFF